MKRAATNVMRLFVALLAPVYGVIVRGERQWAFESMSDSEAAARWREIVAWTRVIGLRRRDAKRAHMTRVLGEADIPFTFHDAVEGVRLADELDALCIERHGRRDIAITKVACTLSHLAAAELADPDNGLWHVIFEDDCAFIGDPLRARAHMVQAMDRAPAGVDVVMFGFCDSWPAQFVFRPWRLMNRHMWRVGRTCRHAYAIRGAGARQLIEGWRVNLGLRPGDTQLTRQDNVAVVCRQPFDWRRPGAQFEVPMPASPVRLRHIQGLVAQVRDRKAGVSSDIRKGNKRLARRQAASSSAAD